MIQLHIVCFVSRIQFAIVVDPFVVGCVVKTRTAMPPMLGTLRTMRLHLKGWAARQTKQRLLTANKRSATRTDTAIGLPPAAASSSPKLTLAFSKYTVVTPDVLPWFIQNEVIVARLKLYLRTSKSSGVLVWSGLRLG